MEISRELCILTCNEHGANRHAQGKTGLISGSLLNNSFRTQLTKYSPDALLFHGRALNLLTCAPQRSNCTNN